MTGIALAELDRRLSNIIRLGAVAELDEAHALVKVSIGDLVTDWLPWVTRRAGGDRSWHAPEVGEQVILLAPSGELAQAVALPSLYQDAYPANGNTKDVHRVTYADGTIVEYDRAAHQLKVDTSASSGKVLINTGSGPVEVLCATAAVTATDSVTVTCATADVTASETVDVSAGTSATVEAPQITLDAAQTTCTGALLVSGLFTYAAGMAGSGGTGGTSASIAGSIHVTGGDVKVDGVGVKTHTHMEQGDGNPVGPPSG